MQCPKCKAADTRVVDSRATDEGRVIRRRRECEKCETRFTTFERLEIAGLQIVKNNGEMEPYSREKLARGIYLACGKRPVSREQIDDLIARLEEKWATKKEISSRELGEDVMAALKALDHVAFIRFASVYRSFKDVEEFKNEIATLFGNK